MSFYFPHYTPFHLLYFVSTALNAPIQDLLLLRSVSHSTVVKICPGISKEALSNRPEAFVYNLDLL